MKECTLLLFEIEQVLAHWTNPSNTNWPGFNDNGFICQFEVCQPWRKPEWFTKQIFKWLWPFKTKCAWFASHSAHFPASPINEWIKSAHSWLTDAQWMSEIRCDLWDIRVQLTINQSINESIWVTRYLAIPFKMIDGVEIIIYMLDWNNKPLKILYYRERIIRQTWLTVSCHSVTGESNESVNKNHSHSSDPFNATT